MIGFSKGVRSSGVGSKKCKIIAGLKKYKPIIQKKKKKKHDKIVLFANNTLINRKLLISRALINSYIGSNEFVSVNNVSKGNMMIGKKKSKIQRLQQFIKILVYL